MVSRSLGAVMAFPFVTFGRIIAGWRQPSLDLDQAPAPGSKAGGSSPMPEPIRVELDAARHVTALAYGAAAPRAGITLILAPGAGAGQKSPFMARFAAAIAARGVDTVTFDFPYREEGRRIPDNNAALEACWRAVIAMVRRRLAPTDTIAI